MNVLKELQQTYKISCKNEICIKIFLKSWVGLETKLWPETEKNALKELQQTYKNKL